VHGRTTLGTTCSNPHRNLSAHGRGFTRCAGAATAMAAGGGGCDMAAGAAAAPAAGAAPLRTGTQSRRMSLLRLWGAKTDCGDSLHPATSIALTTFSRPGWHPFSQSSVVHFNSRRLEKGQALREVGGQREHPLASQLPYVSSSPLLSSHSSLFMPVGAACRRRL